MGEIGSTKIWYIRLNRREHSEYICRGGGNNKNYQTWRGFKLLRL